MKKKIILGIILVFTMSMILAGCGGSTDEDASADKESKGTIRLATTTSTKDSGLLDTLIPQFEEESGYSVDVIAVGSGEAMAMGENGEADVLLVHSPDDEKAFVEAGYADDAGRLDVMYNDFVLLGPNSDPAKVSSNAKDDAVAAFTTIADEEQTFISRGDDSGTHKKELSIWEAASITPEGDWYIEAADGMGAVITMTNEKEGYTLSDRATWLSNGAETDLKIVCENDPSGIMYNQYGVICVNPDINENINVDGAKAFQEWIVSDDVQKTIGEFGVEEYGQALFIPNAK